MKNFRKLNAPRTAGAHLIAALIAICAIASVFTSTVQMQGTLSRDNNAAGAMAAPQMPVEVKPARAEDEQQQPRSFIDDTIRKLNDAAAARERNAAADASALFVSTGDNSPTVAGTCETAGPIEVESSGGTAAGVPTPYATLALAFTAINGATLHTGTITIDVCGNTVETGTGASLNQVAGVTSITMSPAGGAARTISGAITAGNPLINLNGADNVTINGLNTGGNSLTLSNTTVSATSGTATVRLVADATNNTVTNTTILGSSTATLGTSAGNIVIGSGTTIGNDNITISNNNIGPAGANLPSKAIIGSGTSSTIENDNVQITGNNIFDYFSATQSHSGINVVSGNEAWTISNNKFYQTAPRTFTTAILRHAAITINNTSGGFTISGNTIGFGAANGTGTYTISGLDNEFRAIDLPNVRTTAPATLVQNNIISGINQTSSRNSTTTASSAFIAVAMGTSDGLINATGNTIGSLDGSSTIVLNHTSTTASTAPVIGFYNFSFFNTNISNNNIGAITIQSSGTTTGFRGILANTTTGVTATINNNTIGGAVAAGAITDTQVGSYAMYGIQTSLPNLTATGNTIRNMSSASNGASLIVSAGILASGSTGANTISQNTIHSLSNASGAAANSIYGMSLSLPATANVIERNFIHSFSLTSTVSGTQIWGISGGATGTATYKNNMIRLGINAAGSSVTLPSSIIGIRDAAGATNNFYHNSIYIGGTGVLATPTASNSYCFYSDVVTVTRAYQDNIFWNARSNAVAGGVAHIAIRVGGTAPNPPGLTSNYNDLYFSGTDGATGVFNNTVVPTLAAWRTATGQDANSIAGDPNFIAPNGTSSTVDLHVQSNTPIESHGIAIPAVTDDFDGQTRASLTPTDIGADAGNFVSSVIQFNSATYSVNENDGTGVATITLSRTQTVGAVSVTASTVAGGTATPGDDYTTTSIVVTFADGAATATFTIPINNDSIYEGDETVFLALSNPTNGAALGAQNTAILTIVDDETQPTISIANTSAGEGDGFMVFTVTQSGLSAFNTTFQDATADGTATAGSDYTATTNSNGIIPAGSTSTTISIPITDDSVYEGNETFTVTLSNPTNATIATGQGTGTGTIIDNETAPTFSIDDVTHNEGDTGTTTYTFTVTKTGATALTTSVQFTTVDGTATVADNDYTATNGTLSFAPGDMTMPITVNVNGDTSVEPDEAFTVHLSNATAGASITDADGTGTITNDDVAPVGTIQFSAANYNDNETNATHNATITVTRTGGTNGAVSVHYATSDGTATTADNDYTPNSGDLNWADGDAADKTFTVSVTGDTTFEADETVNLTLSAPTGGATLGSPSTATLTILNDDTRPLPNTVYVDDDFTGAPGTDPDGAGPATEIGYDAFPTIQGGVGGVAPNGTVNVAAGTYHEDVNANKTLNLNGAGANVVTISGPIGGSGATIQVTASNVQISGFTITRDGNNTTDWNNPGLNLVGIAVQGQAITGMLVHDNIITGNRTGIDVNNSNGHTVRNNVVDFNRTGFIFRNQTDYQTVVENFITNNWTVGILFLDASGGTNSPVQSAAHSTFSNNDLSGNWYGQIVDRQSGGSLPPPGTRNIKNFRGNWFGTTSPVVTTANSAEPGYAAQIPVAYGGSATPPGGQPDIAGPASANFKYIPFLLSGTDTNIETTPGRGTFGFQGVPNTVVVSPANMNGWAFFDDNPGVGTGSGGFEVGPATPPLGVGSAFLTVDSQGRHALGTAAYAGTRMDDVTDLRYSSYQDNNANTTVAPSLQFDIDYDLTDANTTYHGRLVFEPYQSGTVQQNVWQNWNALAGNWYGTRSTVTINGNVSVPNPCQQNTPCTWQQVLASFPNAGLLNAGALLFKVGGPWSPGFDGNVDAFNISVNAAHVTYDFEPLPNLSIDNVTHLEGNAGQTDYVFTVTLSQAVGQTVTVNYATADDTATVANNDYDQTNGTLTFNPGETTKTVTVKVNGDTAFEPDEAFNVVLTMPTNATISDDTGVGTIQNDDVAVPGTLSFSAATYNVNENEPAQHATITVNRTGGSDGQVTVDYTTSDGTATAGSDYQTASGTLTFADGVTSQTFDVPVIDDSVYEGNETVTLTLSNAGGGATIGSPNSATLNIVENESQPALSINNVTVNEGQSGTTDLVFTVSLSVQSASPVTVNYATADSTAHAPVDYQSANGMLTFPANNNTSQTITVTANGDTIIEGNETFFVNLSGATNAVISDAQGIGTLDNDDGPTGRLAFAKFDFDGDSKADLAVWSGDTGNWHVVNSNGGADTIQLDWGRSALGDVIVPADYDGDGKTDFAVFRHSEGNWYVIQSTTGTAVIYNWGQTGDVPVPGDYDGDNRADVAVWRESDGNWYILNSRDNTVTLRNWGTTGDLPVLGDFDGDRMTDIAIYRASEGNWYIVNSSLNTVTRQNWGANGDRPVPADYDGDGLTDIAVFRAAGNWYIRKSTGGVTLRNWGNADDKLVAADYDGDRETDLAVWRPTEGTWYYINSNTDTGSNYYLGVAGDVPVPSAFVP